MHENDILAGKRLLIVDDERDVLETLNELLSICFIDKAPDFEAGKKFLDKYSYDAAIFDIMGVKGYDLLRIARGKKIPVLMLTAHALSPDQLVKSLQEGASAYIPKDKLPDIAEYVRDMIEARQKGTSRHGHWFSRLKPFFDSQFGKGWREQDRKFWEDFDARRIIVKEDLEEIL